ncbi:conserved hypothetical protein [Culex quinquefasciatus]|uniref:Uncharacterized protein n=1 Tax=Culex quinquefasciatus TaxID=7176 RepID=B0WLC4_CULQU|nr:conserved hypothetical protein [Culex quinquefasciatus]|eukprot:XP_001849508.1 conserved hypothetical protein [Culex quinquefasciatus]
MLPLLFFVLLTASAALGGSDKSSHTSMVKTLRSDVGLAGKVVAFNATSAGSRKPKRSNGEIPLLIIRPIDGKKKKKVYKDPGVKIMSGGVASYGNYPEIHTSDGEIFSLEHMLPILGLEGMFKPSEFHQFLTSSPGKGKEELLHPTLSLGPSSSGVSYKPTESGAPAQSLPSPPPPNFAPAINTEDQLLKLGQQAISKLETPGSTASLVQEKPAFVKPDQLPSKFNFHKMPLEHTQIVKAIPLNHAGFGSSSFFGGHNDIFKHQKPSFGPAPSSQQTFYKKPQMVSPLSISTNFYYPKNVATEEQQQHQYYKHQSQHQSQAPQTYSHQAPAPTPVTHVNYYFPKEIEASPQPQPQTVAHQYPAPPSIQHPSIPVNTVQNGEHVDFVVPKQPSHESQSNPSDKQPFTAFKNQYKQTFQKYQALPQQQLQQPNFYAHKQQPQFEYSNSKPNSYENGPVTYEYHGPSSYHNRSKVETQHLPEPLPYSAPQYLPLPQAQPLQQPAPALTLHQTHPHQHQSQQQQPSPQSQSFQSSSHQSSNGAHWKLARRNHDHIKPVVEPAVDSEADSSHAPTSPVQSVVVKSAKPVEKSTTEVKVEVKHPVSVVAQSRSDDKQQQGARQEQKQQDNGSSSGTSATTRKPRQFRSNLTASEHVKLPV